MRLNWIYFLSIILFAGCNANNEVKKSTSSLDITNKTLVIDSATQVIDTLMLSKSDSAFVVKNKLIKDDMGEQYKEYLIHIYFSNKNWPVLDFKNAIGADLALAGDLDGDLQPELLLRPDWFSSCWASVNLFSLKNNKWDLVKNGSMYFCSDQYPLNKRVVKIANGYGLLTDSLADDKFITLKKSIKF